MRHLKLFTALGIAGLMVAAGLAVAQTYPPPSSWLVHNNTDLIQVVPNGAPSAQAQFNTPAQITNVPGYVKIATQAGVCSTAGTPAANGCAGYWNTFTVGQTYMILVLTGTQNYSYNYTAASPSDGARECIVGSGGAITQASLLAGTGSGQTVTGGSNVSISANSSACWTYSLVNLTWDRS